MSYPRIHEKIFNDVWAIARPSYDAIRSQFLAHTSSLSVLDGTVISGRLQATAPQFSISSDKASYLGGNGLAVIEVSGIIGKRMGDLEMMCGGCDLDTVRASFQAAVADPSIGTILTYYHTPGGTVTGAKEFSDIIFDASQNSGKTIVSYTDTQCCSLGYHLASQAQYVCMADSAHIGSIGCITTYKDQTVADANEGIKYTTIKSGKYKDLGNPHRAMEPEEHEYIQARVDAAASEFFAIVERARGDIDAKGLEAQVLNGAAAMERGLVDALHPTLEDLLTAL